jgi:hypothetical protein
MVVYASQEGKYQTINEEMCGESQQSLSLPPILLVDPQPPDVMLGRGRRYLRHPGNLRLLAVLDMHRVRYDHATNRKEKTLITNEIVQIMQTCGNQSGRFLRFDSSAKGWYEVDGDVARVKVGNALRYARYNERRELTGSSSHRSKQSDTVNASDQAASFSQQATVLVPDQLQRTQSKVSGSSPTTIRNGELVSDTSVLANLGNDNLASPTQEEEGEAWKQKHSDMLAQQHKERESSTIRSGDLVSNSAILANLGYDILGPPTKEEERHAWNQKYSDLLAQQQEERVAWKQKHSDLLTQQHEERESSTIRSGDLVSNAAILANLGYDILGSPTKEEERDAWNQKYFDLLAQQQEAEVWKRKHSDMLAQQQDIFRNLSD